MNEFVLKEVKSNDISSELLKIGYDEGYRFIMAEKFKYKNIKIYNLSTAQANILKQTALSVGADCGTHRDVVTGKAESSDVILCGSIAQLKKSAEKLKLQPFKLDILADNILSLLNTDERKTKIVGILNITPNSFSDGGKYLNIEDGKKHLIKLIEDGADIVDIGAESTKPYSEEVSAETQIERIAPILDFIQKENIKIPISLDTRSSVVAKFGLDNGVSIINDVSGFDYDKNMAMTVAENNAAVIIQHSQGNPKNMQDNPQYNDVVEDIYFELKKKIEYAQSLGIRDIIIDAGIGFGKTKKDNFEIINRVEEFYSLKMPIMLGISRKSMLNVNNIDSSSYRKTVNDIDAENKNNEDKLISQENYIKDALTLAVSYPLINKVDFLRVHNVKLHKLMLDL